MRSCVNFLFWILIWKTLLNCFKLYYSVFFPLQLVIEFLYLSLQLSILVFKFIRSFFCLFEALLYWVNLGLVCGHLKDLFFMHLLYCIFILLSNIFHVTLHFCNLLLVNLDLYRYCTFLRCIIPRLLFNLGFVDFKNILQMLNLVIFI
jgi:hypothetical protein